MFSNILSHFKDFPTTDILFYAPLSSYNPMTGEMESSYEYDYKVAAHGYQKNALKGLLNEKVWDTVDKVFIFDQGFAPPPENIIWHDQFWYKIVFPDNVGFAGSVCVIGAERIDTQVITDTPPEDYIVLGDSGGIL